MPGTAKFETKSFNVLEMKYVEDDGRGYLEGYASVKNVVDSYGDVIVDGAYDGLTEMIKDSWSGFNHSDRPAAYCENALEDTKGLKVRLAFHSTEFGQETRTIAKERLEAGKSVGMSIMYRTLESEDSQVDGKSVRLLKKIQIAEMGIVMLPAAKSAQAISVKSGSGTPLDAQVGDVRERLEDLGSRLVDLHEKRDGKLPETRVAEWCAIAQKANEIATLLSKSEADEEPPAMADTDEVARLTAALTTSGVIN